MSPPVDREVAREHGLSESEWQLVLDRMGRTPSWVELGVISVMWSEHCSYKSSRRHLKKLPTEAPWVLQGPGENAGVIDVGEGLAACFKMESHNHPSFIEPYQGAATGVGGILRDIFTMGARPIANMNSLRFGRPEGARMRFLVAGVAAGIGGYGNCIGVPTVGGEIAFDSSYDGNILVNAFTLGVLGSDRIFRSAAAGVGSSVMYVGSKTGRDGIHGATMASEEFGADSEAKRPRVQVGDPFTEKKLLEACLELMKKDAIVAIQDMGAAGLTSSSCEMAAKGGLGIEIDCGRVPRREEGMTPYEVMLSETQERMLMVVRPGTEAEVEAIFRKWDLAVAVVGKVTDSQHVVVTDGEEVVGSIPVDLLVDAAPNYDRPRSRPVDLDERWSQTPQIPSQSPEERLLSLLAQPTITSKRWVFEQYDSTVRNGTVLGPGVADAAVVRLPDADGQPRVTSRGLAMTVDMNGRFVVLDPWRGAALGVVEAARNLACVGARPLAITDCLNFGNPEKPEVMWSFAEALEGMGAACRALRTPVVSGNVSLYNETEGRAILPTPTVGMVGVVEHIENVPGLGFRAPGDVVLVVGEPKKARWAGSECSSMAGQDGRGRPIEPDFAATLALLDGMEQIVARGWLQSSHDAAEGGLAVAVAEACLAEPALGAELDWPWTEDEMIFGEGPDVLVLSVAPEHVGSVTTELERRGLSVHRAGKVTNDGRLRWPGLDVEVSALAKAFRGGLEEALGH
ncbi:MAG: phosphoribosylformylglycinamidine synthase subunit PurL [Myxococcota bacterium]